MDEQNLETNQQNNASGNFNAPLPKSSNPFLKWTLAVLGLLIILVVVILLTLKFGKINLTFWKQNATTQKQNLPSANNLKTQPSATQPTPQAQVSEPIAVLPPSGFPDDLLIEPDGAILTNTSTISSNNSLITAERKYTSAYDLAFDYQTAEGYLRYKGWAVTELPAAKPETQESLRAVKAGCIATLIFNSGDGKHAVVDITAVSSLK